MVNKSITNVQYLKIDLERVGQRIDNFLISYLKNVPKSHVYRILRKGEVRVNKKRVQASYRLKAEDELRIPPLKLELSKPALKPGQKIINTLTDRILYEDNNLMIINKPMGMAVHGGSGVRLGLVESLRQIYPKLPHLELAHRLDRDTSGCIILAKKRSILKELHELLRMGEVKKIYLALTKGHWQAHELEVAAPLLKNQLSSGERIVKVHKEGKDSLTVFRILEIFPMATLVEAILYTGRTHQIRVHAQYRNHPLACDEKYGDREFNREMRKFGLKRIFLHSHFVEFSLPSTGQKISVTAPLDEDLAKCLSTLKKYIFDSILPSE